MKSVRASSLPLAFRCAQSLFPRPPLIEERVEAADVGTAAHDWCASGGWDLERVPEFARKHGIENVAELRSLCGKARRMAEKLGAAFGGSHELELEALLLPGNVTVSGHIDWNDSGTVVATVVDWKFGMKDRDHREQLRAYACLLMWNRPAVLQVQVVTAWIRDEELESEIFTRAELVTWAGQVEALTRDETYRPGNHCQHCRRLHECEAGKTQIARDLELFGSSVRNLADLEPERAIDLLEKADMVAALAARVRAEFRDHVIAHGDIEAPDGRRLTISTQKQRRVRVLEAWPVLEERFSSEELASAITVSLSELEEIAAKKAQRGQGAARKRQLSRALEGAIDFEEIRKLVVRRK